MTALLKRTFLSTILVILIITTLLAAPNPVQAASMIYVNTTDDQYGEDVSHCALREAVVAANKNAAFGGCRAGSTGEDQILLPPGVYTLDRTGANEDQAARGDLDILNSVSIIGSGTGDSGTMIQGDSDRIFHVKSLSPVTISSMTITYGRPIGGEDSGGGILNENSSLTLNFVVITRNIAGNVGGGIYNTSKSTLTINYSTLTVNSATFGGGIYNAGTLKINNSLLSANTAGDSGGGLDNNSGANTATIVNSTIAINTADTGSGISNSGTGTYGIKIIGSTIVNNVKGVGFVNKDYAKALFQNSIIAEHENNQNCSFGVNSSVTSNGYNLESANTCRLNGTGDLVNQINPGISVTLRNNGGPTLTYSLEESSPALNQIPVEKCRISPTDPRPYTDQRMYGRPDGDSGKCDIGAFERNGTTNSVFLPSVRK